MLTKINLSTQFSALKFLSSKNFNFLEASRKISTMALTSHRSPLQGCFNITTKPRLISWTSWVPFSWHLQWNPKFFQPPREMEFGSKTPTKFHFPWNGKKFVFVFFVVFYLVVFNLSNNTWFTLVLCFKKQQGRQRYGTFSLYLQLRHIFKDLIQFTGTKTKTVLYIIFMLISRRLLTAFPSIYFITSPQWKKEKHLQ